MCGVGRGGHQVQLPPRQFRGLWSLGIAGSATTCKNEPMGALMMKLKACVGVWGYAAVNNDKLKDIQRQLEEDFHEIYELFRRNDTRCD